MSQSNKPNPNKFITNIFGDNFLPSINGKKFEEIAYSTYFDIDILPQLSKEFTFYIFIGTDSGMLLKHLQLLNTAPDSIYLFIEDSKILQHINTDILNIKQSNILISTIDEWQKQAKLADIIKYIEVDRIQIIKSFSAQEQTHLPYTSIAQKIHDEINQLKWMHPDKFQKKIYIQRQIENCSENFNPAIKLKGLLQGKPALILAGGPSLDDYIDWIEEHQQYYVVIAVSRIARRLLSTKIIPDIFVTADPFESAFTTSKEVLAFGKKSILVSHNYAHPRLIGQWQGQHFYLGELLPWDTNYKPENIKGIGPTVANCAIHLAIQMGMINQILFGVDLCYSTSGFSHVSSTDEYEQGANLGFTGVSIKTNDNDSAETTYELSEARTSISLLAELVKKQGGEIINPNPGSAHIDNVLYQTIDNISIPINPIDGYSLIINQLETLQSEKQVSHYSKVLEEHNKLIQESNKILSRVKEIINLGSSEQNKDTNTDNLSNIIELKQTLVPYAKKTNIIESFGINGYYDFVHPDKINKPNDINNITEQYYTSLYIACDSFIEFINDSIQRIESRIIEFSIEDKIKQTDIKKILEQWEQDKQYGRMLLLQDKNHSLYNQLTHKNQKKYKNKFKKLFNFSQNKQSSKQKGIIKLENIEKKLYHFFQTKDVDNLSLIIEQINNLNNDDSTALANLAQGYLYELDNKTDLAINEYLNANSKQTLESALKRILDITLKQGDIENTIAVLNALSNISPDYLIQLANLYQISKQHKDALDTYSVYIDTNPKDILILIKMGLLYLSLGIIDGAEFIFKHVLEIDPNNQSAPGYLKQNRTELYNVENKYNDLIIEQYDFIGKDEYNSYKLLNDKNLDIERLSNAEKRGAIGFIATNENIRNNMFINYIKELYQIFPQVNFKIFYFVDTIKDGLKNTFQNQLSRVQLIKPIDIYDIVENIEIYITYSDINDNHISHFKAMNLREIRNIIKFNCKNIMVTPFRNEYFKETLKETSLRMSAHPILKNYQKLGFNKHDMERGNYQYIKVLHTKALNFSKKNTYQYKENDLTYIKNIELALKHKNYIHFQHKLKLKITAI